MPSENKVYNLPLYEEKRAQVYGFEQLKIIENSKLGKEKFGTVFYVADLLADIIYKVDAQKNATELVRGVGFPSSIAVDSVGDVFYTTSPLRESYSKTIFPAFYKLNPETRESTIIYTFKEEVESFWGGIGLYVEFNGKEYELPGGFNISNTLYESADKLNFLFTNSHQGALIKLSADKY